MTTDPEPSSGVLIVGGTVQTMTAQGTASAVGIENGRIRAVGSEAEVRQQLRPDVATIDVDGRHVLPGFIDAHSHPVTNAQQLIALDFRRARSIDDLVSLVEQAAAATAPGDVIKGMGLDYRTFRDGRLPTRWDLDEATDRHPVVIYCVGGHFVLANTPAMERGGVSDGMADPRGGHFVRDAQGRMTGLCLDAATSFVVPGVDVGSHGPNLHIHDDVETLSERLGELYERYLGYGITTIVDAQVTSLELSVYQHARRAGNLPVRTVCMPLSHALRGIKELGLEAPFGDDQLLLSGMKFYVDGTLNGGTVLFDSCDLLHSQRAEYGFPPSVFWDAEQLTAAVCEANAQHLPVAIHCHGGTAIEMALGALERASLNGHDDLRNRLEHASFLSAPSIKRMSQLGVIAVVQPIMLYNYGDWLLTTYDDAASDVQPFRKQLEGGVTVALSGDNILPMDPLKVMQESTLRRTRAGQLISGDQALSPLEALRGYTIEAATAIGMEDDLGSIEAGKLADLIVVDGDLLSSSREDIGGLEIWLTMVGGSVAWSRDNSWRSRAIRMLDR
jgi:predicted amidohydrolase YtcJ